MGLLREQRGIFSKYRRGLKARKNQGHFELKSQKLNQLKIGKNGKKWFVNGKTMVGAESEED